MTNTSVEPQRILVIEDETPVRENIVELLALEGYQAFGFPDGPSGLAFLEKQSVDLILCDIMMPEMDGYQVLAEIRRRDQFSSIPFVFLTAKSSRADQRKGMEGGADDFLPKPFSRQELLKAIQSRLQRQEALTRSFQEQLNDLRSSLARAFPHEILTPLTAVIGFSGLLLKEFDSVNKQEILESLRHIHDAGHRMHRTVNKILRFVELESLRANGDRFSQLVSRTCRTRTIISASATEAAADAGRTADIRLNIDEDNILFSEEWLKTVVYEVVENACKFSPPGSLLEIEGIIQAPEYVFRCSDQGRGMTTEQISRIEAFQQFDRRRFEQQGLGLGCILVKRILEGFSHSVRFLARPERGTTVEFRFGRP